MVAYDGGACNGNWFDPKFLQAPYITMDHGSITATITSDVVRKNACIHQGTTHTCQFFAGSNGISQVEFDYHVEGDRWSNWYSFWLNPVGAGGKWIKDCEIDMLENMYRNMGHNFAGLPHQTNFKSENGMDGHVTLTLQDTGA